MATEIWPEQYTSLTPKIRRAHGSPWLVIGSAFSAGSPSYLEIHYDGDNPAYPFLDPSTLPNDLRKDAKILNRQHERGMRLRIARMTEVTSDILAFWKDRTNAFWRLRAAGYSVEW